MIVTTSVTKIELSADERDILRDALVTLKEVNDVIINTNMNYITNGTDMALYDEIYDEIKRIEDYIMIE